MGDQPASAAEALRVEQTADGAHVTVAARPLRAGEVLVASPLFCVPRTHLHVALTPICEELHLDGAVDGDDDDDAADSAEEAFWVFARAAPPTPGGSALAATRWCLPPRQVRLIRHRDAQGAASAEVSVVPAADADGAVTLHVRVLAAVAAGKELTADAAPGARTASRAARLLALLPRARWAEPLEREQLRAALAAMPAPQPAAPPPPRRTGREGAPLAVLSPPVRVCTDYPLLIEQLRNSRRFHVVADADSAHALWSVRPIRDFAALPSGLVRNQFPYEGCLVSKDLLPQTCRRAAAPPLDFPPWYPPCFDLRTEAHLWLAHRRALRSGGGCGPGVGVWVAKLAGGTRSADLCVSASARCLLRHAEAPGGDRVLQRYVERPLLLQGAKFDVRVYVAVRSFAPLAAALDRRYYARRARRPFSLAPEELADGAVHGTVNWYAGGDAPPAAAGALPELLTRAQLEAAAAAEGIEWAPVHAALARALRELFAAAGDVIGAWPESRALYGVDVTFDAVLTPQLLECNFAGDWATAVHRVPDPAAASFVEDVLTGLLCVDEPWGERWEPLSGGGSAP